jgi:hypothetical protein
MNKITQFYHAAVGPLPKPPEEAVIYYLAVFRR